MVLCVVNPSYDEDVYDLSKRQTFQHARSRRTRATRISLVTDILRLIILEVNQTADLASFALVSRYCNAIATPLLYSSLCFGPAAFRRSPGSAHDRSHQTYVSSSAESLCVRTDIGAEDDFFNNRSSLCAETLSTTPRLLAHVRSLATNFTVPDYGTAVRASRGQRSSEDQPFREWAGLLALPQTSSLRHVALSGVTDRHLVELVLARHLKLTALELSVSSSALPELTHLASLLYRQRLITHFASRNLAQIRELHDESVPRLTHIDVPAALARQLAPGRPITSARIFPLATRRAATGMNSASEVLMAVRALAESTHPLGVTNLDVSVLWHSDSRMGDDCTAFFSAIRDSLRDLRWLKITLWSDLTPRNMDILFDCIMSTLPALTLLESFEVRTWAEYGINHPSHVPHGTRRALFDVWKSLCPTLVRVSAIERNSWVWHFSGPRLTPPPSMLRAGSEPDTATLRRPLPPRPRPASGDWVQSSGQWGWIPAGSSSIRAIAPSNSSSLSTTGHPAPRSQTAGGSWVRERSPVKDHEPSWSSDLQVMGSTYQRNWQDEHYVNAAARSFGDITFAIPFV